MPQFLRFADVLRLCWLCVQMVEADGVATGKRKRGILISQFCVAFPFFPFLRSRVSVCFVL